MNLVGNDLFLVCREDFSGRQFQALAVPGHGLFEEGPDRFGKLVPPEVDPLGRKQFTVPCLLALPGKHHGHVGEAVLIHGFHVKYPLWVGLPTRPDFPTVHHQRWISGKFCAQNLSAAPLLAI